MRVLWLSHFYPYPPAGGALQRSHHLLRQIASRHSIDLLALRKSRNRPSEDIMREDYPPPSQFCSRVETRAIPSEESLLGRWWVLLSGLTSSDPYDDRWLRSSDFLDRVSKLAHTRSYDIIHLDSIGLAQFSPQDVTIPTVLNHHNIESHMMARRATQEHGRLRRWYLLREAHKLAASEARWAAKLDHNLVVSHLDGARLEKVAPTADWTVIPNGVDVEYFTPDAGRDTREGLIFVGRLSWYPNRDAIDWFLDDIWPTLYSEDPTRTFTIVGSSPPSSVRARHSQRNLRATGFVPDVRPYLNQAAIYVCPIRTGGGTRLKILDAMAMAMPLVATSMAVEGLDLEPDRHYIRADTPHEFITAVRMLESSPERRRELGQQVRREAVRRFSWSHIGDQLEATYRTVLNRENSAT